MNKKRTRTVDWREKRRYRAVELKHAGWTHEEIAEALDVCTRAVTQWMKGVREEGKAGLQARPQPGATPKLAAEELALLPALLARGAEVYRFRGEVWTCTRIARVIEWEVGVSYHKDHVSRLLKAIEWTPQRPIGPATQRNEREIAHWRTNVWPELKKSTA